MSARILDGLSLGRLIQEEIKPKISAFSNQYGRQPCLGIVLVGDDLVAHHGDGHDPCLRGLDGEVSPLRSQIGHRNLRTHQ